MPRTILPDPPAHLKRLSETLSGVLLARALYREPQILFLDETFDQLDLARERSITDGLRKTGIGLVIVSHRPETVGAVDRIVRLGPDGEPESRRAA